MMTNETEKHRKTFVLKDRRKMSYLEYGNPDNQTIFCVHGLNRNATDYHFLARKLERDYRIISIDVAGRGFSDNLPNVEDYTYCNHLIDIAELLDYLQLKNIIWFGTSMGGVFGIILYSRRPNLIKKIILNDVGPIIPIAGTIQSMKYLSEIPESFDSREEIENKIKDIFCLFGMKRKEHWDFFIENSIYECDKKWHLQYDKKLVQNFNPNDKFNQYLRVRGMWDKWAKINVPILLIWGKLSNTLRIDTIDTMRNNKNLTRIAVVDAGHTPHLMDNTLNKLIFKWLNNQLIEDVEIFFRKEVI